jgi:hypothetical protein
MPNPLRVTMFFDDGITGWSESHYDTISTNLQAAVAFCVANLVPARGNLLAAGPWLKYIRASYDNVFRDSQVFFTPQPPIGPFFSYINNSIWNNNPSASDWTCVLLRGVGGDLYRAPFYVSGIPYLDPNDVSTPQQDPVLVAAFNNYARALTINSYGFAVWLRDQLTYPLKPVVSIVAAPLPAPGYVLNVPLHGFTAAPGNRVYIYNSRFVVLPGQLVGRSPNGPYSFTVQDANNIVIPNFRFPAGTTFVSAQIQLNQRGVVPYQSILMERFTHRKRGRPFDSPRGRSRRRTSTFSVVI